MTWSAEQYARFEKIGAGFILMSRDIQPGMKKVPGSFPYRDENEPGTFSPGTFSPVKVPSPFCVRRGMLCQRQRFSG
jgi:hypothetical protein